MSLAHLIATEAVNSVAFDGETQAVPRATRADRGFGCPGCGAGLHSLSPGDAVRGLPCCGYVPEGAEAYRLAVAFRLRQAA